MGFSAFQRESSKIQAPDLAGCREAASQGTKTPWASSQRRSRSENRIHGSSRWSRWKPEGNFPKIPEIPLTLPGSTNRGLEWLDSEDLYFLLNMGKNSSNSMLDAIFPITSLVPVEKAGLFERFHDPIDWRISHPFRSHEQESKTKTRT